MRATNPNEPSGECAALAAAERFGVLHGDVMADIKPPTGPSSLDPSALGPDGASEGSPTTGTPEGPAFSAHVDAASQQNAASAADMSPVDAIAARVQAGELSQEQAIERLIERAIDDVKGHLSEAQRSELAETMRGALASDPTLLALQASLTK